MKSVDFFNTPNHKKQQTMHRWFCSSCIVLVTLVCCLSIMQIRIYAEYKDTQKKISALQPMEAQLSTCLTQKRELKQQTDRLKHRLSKTTRIKRKPKNPASLLKIIQEHAHNIDIQTLQIDKKDISLQLYATSANAIIDYVDTLKSYKKFAYIDLNGIEQNDTLIKATIHIEVR